MELEINRILLINETEATLYLSKTLYGHKIVDIGFYLLKFEVIEC